jgi:excisionase family DNA binding protein
MAHEETTGWYADGADEASYDVRIDRLTVNEAAKVLKVSPSAVRKRVERGTLPADKDEDGRLFVYVDTEETRRATRRDASHDDDVRDALIAELKDRVRYLEEESRRKDTVLLSLSEGLKALEAPRREGRGSPDTATDDERGSSASVTEAPERSWLRRFFGL